MVNTNDSWYQYPNGTDSESLFNYMGYVNNVVDGLFFPVILLVIWVISFLTAFAASGGGRPAAARSWVVSSFIVSILSIMSSIMGFLAPKFMYLSFIALALGLLWLRLETPSMD